MAAILPGFGHDTNIGIADCVVIMQPQIFHIFLCGDTQRITADSHGELGRCDNIYTAGEGVWVAFGERLESECKYL